MIKCSYELPEPNTVCKVLCIPHLAKEYNGGLYKFITYSDGGGYFWDNGETVLQENEVIAWEIPIN